MSEKIEGLFDVLQAYLTGNAAALEILNTLYDEVGDMHENLSNATEDKEYYQSYYERRENYDLQKQYSRYGAY